MARRRRPWLWAATKGKTAEGSTTLYLENYKLVPGDIISIYATARDALSASRSDIFFVEAQPFERTYSQSQQMGGMGGGGEQAPQVSEHQKEIIAATWNQLKNPQKNAAEEQENARLLSGIQSKLRDQAKSLAERMRSRELHSTNPAFKKFADDMSQAVESMGPATEKLRGREWQAALPPEQKSLQHLLRAEAIFRDIQVAFGNGAGGAGGAGRDLEGLFDLELDREKNQFETGRNAASPDQRQKEIEEALAKLEELARRQQELAEQQRQKQQAYQQRWQQEMLRREAEELRKRWSSWRAASSLHRKAGRDSRGKTASKARASRLKASRARASRESRKGRDVIRRAEFGAQSCDRASGRSHAGHAKRGLPAEPGNGAERGGSPPRRRTAPRSAPDAGRRTQTAGWPADGRVGKKIPGACRAAAEF